MFGYLLIIPSIILIAQSDVKQLLPDMGFDAGVSLDEYKLRYALLSAEGLKSYIRVIVLLKVAYSNEALQFKN